MTITFEKIHYTQRMETDQHKSRDIFEFCIFTKIIDNVNVWLRRPILTVLWPPTINAFPPYTNLGRNNLKYNNINRSFLKIGKCFQEKHRYLFCLQGTGKKINDIRCLNLAVCHLCKINALYFQNNYGRRMSCLICWAFFSHQA